MNTNGIISDCSKYIICREMWEMSERNTQFSCKDCVGYECYCKGYRDGLKENKE